MNPILIVARFFTAALILKIPLVGGVVSVALDNLDWYVKDLWGVPPIGEYESLDKLLDLWYLSFILVVVLKFKNILVRNVLVALFIYRVIGIALFELTNARFLLFVFPNIFENFFFFYYILKKLSLGEPAMPLGLFGLFLSLVTFLKFVEEFAMHVIQKPLPILLAGAYLSGIIVLYRFLLKKTY